MDSPISTWHERALRPWRWLSDRARRVRERWRRETAFRWHVASVLVAIGILGTAFAVVVGPMIGDWSTFGFHDWDVETSYRYITVLSLKEYGEGPWWHPWLCGGVPAWGHVEAATNLVSPYLPFYLFTDIRTAVRLEVIGGAVTAMAGAW